MKEKYIEAYNNATQLLKFLGENIGDNSTETFWADQYGVGFAGDIGEMYDCLESCIEYLSLVINSMG